MEITIDMPPRIETGVIKFKYNDGSTDWGGVFIRGDNCHAYAASLKHMLEVTDCGVLHKTALMDLATLLDSSCE